MGKKEDNRVRKLVSFNKTKKVDAEMLKHIARRNFSGYMKKLIKQDMLNMGKLKLVEDEKKEPNALEAEVLKKEEVSIMVKDETNQEKLDRLKKELQSGKSGVYIPNQPKKY